MVAALQKAINLRENIKIRCQVVETLNSFIGKRYRPLMNKQYTLVLIPQVYVVRWQILSIKDASRVTKIYH